MREHDDTVVIGVGQTGLAMSRRWSSALVSMWCWNGGRLALASKLLVIKVAPEWRLTRFIDRNLHEWAMFIKPEELVVTLGRHGLQMGEMVGLGPRPRNPSASSPASFSA